MEIIKILKKNTNKMKALNRYKIITKIKQYEKKIKITIRLSQK